MVQIEGKYQHVKNENIKEFILGVGLTEEFAVKAESVTASLEISKSGDAITMKTVYPTKTTTLTFTLGAEFDDPMPNGMVLKSVAKMEGEKIKICSKKDGKDLGHRTYEFSDSGVVIVMGATSTAVVGKRTYKRV